MTTHLHRATAALNRRRFLALAGGAVGSAILAACGGSSATDTPKPATATTGAAPATAPAAAAPTTAAGSAAAATRPAGSAPSGTTTGSAAASTTAPATTAAGTSAASSAVATRPAASAVTANATSVTGSAAAGGTTGQLLVIEAAEYSFKTLGSIPAGVTTVQMKNIGKENHEAQILRLNDGVTYEQLLAALAASGGNGEPPPIFTYEGGPAEIVPNKVSEVVLDLKEGQYALLCFVTGSDGTPHAAKGMVAPIKVTPATGAAATLPTGSGAIALGDASFDIPESLPAGRRTFRLTNGGKSARAFFVGGIPADKTIDDVQQELAKPDAPPPPWFTANGGMDGLKPGGAGAVVLDLVPGKYVAVDVAFGPEQPTAKVFTVK